MSDSLLEKLVEAISCLTHELRALREHRFERMLFEELENGRKSFHRLEIGLENVIKLDKQILGLVKHSLGPAGEEALAKVRASLETINAEGAKLDAESAELDKAMPVAIP